MKKKSGELLKIYSNFNKNLVFLRIDMKKNRKKKTPKFLFHCHLINQSLRIFLEI